MTASTSASRFAQIVAAASLTGETVYVTRASDNSASYCWVGSLGQSFRIDNGTKIGGAWLYFAADVVEALVNAGCADATTDDRPTDYLMNQNAAAFALLAGLVRVAGGAMFVAGVHGAITTDLIRHEAAWRGMGALAA